MSFASRIVLEITGTAALGRREVNNIVKLCWHDVGLHWHQKFRPRHFSAAAWSLYRYKPRSRRYWFRKMKKTGQGLPLVFSGESRRLSQNAQITSTFKGVRIAMTVGKMTFRPQLVDELKQINEQEYRELEGVMGKSLERELNQSRHKVRVVIGGKAA